MAFTELGRTCLAWLGVVAVPLGPGIGLSQAGRGSEETELGILP